jgi:hypothetical protein
VESNFVTLVEMGSCWFGVYISHIECKGVGHVGEVELWAPYYFSYPQL